MEVTAIANTERVEREHMADSLKELTGTVEHLLKFAKRDGSEQFNAARDQLEHKLVLLKREFVDLEAGAAYQARRAVRVVDRGMHDHPYAAMGIAIGTGLLLGLLASRR